MFSDITLPWTIIIILIEWFISSQPPQYVILYISFFIIYNQTFFLFHFLQIYLNYCYRFLLKACLRNRNLENNAKSIKRIKKPFLSNWCMTFCWRHCQMQNLVFFFFFFSLPALRNFTILFALKIKTVFTGAKFGIYLHQRSQDVEEISASSSVP